MNTAVSTPTKILPLKALFSEIVFQFLEKTKPGDTFTSNPWVRELRDRIKATLGVLAEQYDLKLRPLGGVGMIRRNNNQYASFFRPPLQTSRGFFSTVGFRFDLHVVQYSIGYSNDNPVPESFIQTLREVGREKLPDFTEQTSQGLPQKSYDLGNTTDEELTADLLRLLDVYCTCIDRLGEEIAEFGRAEDVQKFKGVLTPQQLDVLLDAYVAWCEANKDEEHLRDEHSPDYAKWSREYFQKIPPQQLAEEMTRFVGIGGKIQSGGHRFKTKFADALVGREEEFRSHLLKVYEPSFDLSQWWEDSDAFPGFGVGTRSIFLHRALPNKYTVFNQKALAGYELLGVMPKGRRKGKSEYDLVNEAGHALVSKRPDKLTLFLADHLTHYITIPEGKAVVERLLGSQAAAAYRTWIIAGGEGGTSAEAFIGDSNIRIDFDITESLASCSSLQQIEAVIQRYHPGSEHRSWANSCLYLAHEMKPGDVVVLRSGQKTINAIGVISSGYRFLESAAEYCHRRQVEWLTTDGWNLSDNDKPLQRDTVLALDQDTVRFEQVKRVTQWSEFEPDIQRLHERFRLGRPFSTLFHDRDEAHAAFDLFKEALETLQITSKSDDRLSMTLPNEGKTLSLNYGSRLVLRFEGAPEGVPVSFCARKEDLAPGETFEAGEFSRDKEGVGLGLQIRSLSDLRPASPLHDSFTRALAELKRTYSQRTPFQDRHIPELFDAAMDKKLRDELLSHGLASPEMKYEMVEEPVLLLRENPVAKGRNVIYFGPPGTGKTWTLLTKERERFVAKTQTLSREERLRALVADQSWWVVIAAALYKMGPSKVPDLLNHPLVAARFATTSVKAPRSTLWVPLQSHTAPDCSNVSLSLASRVEPFIFSKAADSTWSVVTEKLAAEAPEVLELAELSEREAPTGETISRYETVTFHQSFSYEDFIEGIKPQVGAEGSAALGYEIQPGIFKRLCERARADKQHEYAIFIDEINRGNVASIFGELISLIEEDKREGSSKEIAVRLPYSKELFTVPANVSIIGTMNSADRSVEALDTALRRRFTFIEMAPSVDALRAAEIAIEEIDIPKLFETINRRLEKLLNKDHQIGHAYFLELATARSSLSELRTLFKTKIIPLLQEYFYSDLGKVGLVLGKRFITTVADTDFAAFDHPESDLMHERQVYRLKDPDTLSAEDFTSIYGQ